MNRVTIKQKVLSYLCILTLIVTMVPSVAFAAKTKDISSHWAGDQINELLEKGFITGYPDGSFRPDQQITRAEFMAIANRAFGYSEKTDASFTDVKAGAWYGAVVEQAKAAGYVNGYSDGTIRPGDPITRQEAAVIIAKIKGLPGDVSAAAGFGDTDKISGWSKPSIGAASEAGLMGGYPDGTFQAAKKITRAEAVVVIGKALKMKTFGSAGVFGPESGIETIEGNACVYADGVTLQNLVINGNLLITKDVKEGTATLKNVTVKGTTKINGGGENSVVIIDSTLGNVTVSKEDGKIRIVVSGNTTVGQVTAASGAKIEENGLTGGAGGFGVILIEAAAGDMIRLTGSFDQVRIEAKGIKLDLPGGSTVGTLVLNQPASVTGSGTVKLAEVNADGSTFETQPKSIKEADSVSSSDTSSGGGSGGGGGGSHHDTVADLVMLDGTVYSVNSTDKNASASIAQAVVIKDGKTIYVGSDSVAANYIGNGTQVIDLNGKMVIPGFSDAHAHSKAMAANMFDLSLYSCTTKAECLTAIENWCDANQPAYITGNGWSTLISSTLSKEDLDGIPGCSDIPIVLYDTSHHMAWANSKAIAIAGITADTPDPLGGVIERDSHGAPTGIFHEDSAIGLVMKAIPDNTVDQYIAGIMAYQAMANSYGITLTQDPQLSDNAITAYQTLAQAGLLTMRVRGGYLTAPFLTSDGSAYEDLTDAAIQMDDYISDRLDQHEVGDLFRTSFVKVYEDGGGPTSAMKETFLDGTTCAAIWPADQLKLFVDKLEKSGFQIHCHAMGDRALAELLDAFEYAEAQGDPALRNSITHLMAVDDGSEESDDIKRMADLGIVGIPQPFWMVKDAYYTSYWMYSGEDETNKFYPMKSLVNGGVVMAGGSDWPVTMPNTPLTSIQCGITRTLPYDSIALALMYPDSNRNPMYRYPLGPISDPTQECVDLKTMIQSVTINGAYAMFLEDVTGSIEVGKSADMVILDKSLQTVPSKDIDKTNVMMTLFKGKIVYQATDISISDYQVVTYKMTPSYPGDTTPFLLTIADGTTTADLTEALNAPVNGSFVIIDTANSNAVVAADNAALVTDSMKVVATAESGSTSTYTIVVDAPDAVNGFTVSNITATGCTITLDTPITGLSAKDVYLLRDSDKVSAATMDVSTSDGGTTYIIEAGDLEEDGSLTLLSGLHTIYVYSPYCPPYVSYPDADFGDDQGQNVLFP